MPKLHAGLEHLKEGMSQTCVYQKKKAFMADA
uniref:Uncharacterized protein n=1 Tax=Anguilla anguilla TaxID=7936 RepID=A0A0E9T3Z3_ANGAN